MVLPIPVYAIKGVGLVQGIVCVAKGYVILFGRSISPSLSLSLCVCVRLCVFLLYECMDVVYIVTWMDYDDFY